MGWVGCDMELCGRVSWAVGKATSSDTMWAGLLKFLEFTEKVLHSRIWARFESAGQGGRVPLGGLAWLGFRCRLVACLVGLLWLVGLTGFLRNLGLLRWVGTLPWLGY